MTCKQLGGAWDIEFHADTFDSIADQSKKHAMKMFRKGDKPHLEAMNKMQVLMKTLTQWENGLRTKEKNFMRFEMNTD